MSPSSRNRALAELQKAQKAKERRTRIVLVAGVSAAVLVIAGAVGFAVWRDTSNRPSLDAVRTFSNITANHVTTHFMVLSFSCCFFNEGDRGFKVRSK